MAKYRIVKTADIERLSSRVEQLEQKGYYDGENKNNELFQRIRHMLEGTKLPPATAMDRFAVADAYEHMGAVNGVINYIASNVGEVAKYFELRMLKPDGTYEYVSQHWLLDRLRQPNDRYNLKRFVNAWAVNRLLFDDAWVYAPLSKGKDRIIDPHIGMHVIPSHRIAIEAGGAMKPMKAVRIIGPDDKPIEDITGKIFESFGYSLDMGSFFGTSKVVAAAVYLSIIDKGMRREDKSLDNGGPANIITPKADGMGVLPQDADTIEKEFNGDKTFNKTKALRTAIELHTLGSNPVDLGILESHKEAVTALCFVFNLPVDLYYGQAKYENQKEAKKAIYELQAIPLAEEFAADLLRYTGLDVQGYELVVNRDNISVLRTSPTEVLDNLSKMHASLNEMRTANGYDPIDEPYADQPILPMGVMFGNEDYDITEE